MGGGGGVLAMRFGGGVLFQKLVAGLFPQLYHKETKCSYIHICFLLSLGGGFGDCVSYVFFSKSNVILVAILKMCNLCNLRNPPHFTVTLPLIQKAVHN